MFATDDTIVAIATPPGPGGIGVVRVSGPASQAVARAVLQRQAPLAARHATFVRVRGTDDVIATLFPQPHSYTGDDVVEISAHGSPVVLRALVEAAMRAGARLAEPGEFTLRAFLNGRLDLVQSEAVADLIDAVTPLQARVACDQLEGTLTRRLGDVDRRLFDVIARLEASLDFPDEGYHFIAPAEIASVLRDLGAEIDVLLRGACAGRTIREGAAVVIAGRPNVGKSSLFNALAGHERAIVTPVPGTTRDLVTERVDIGGIPVTLADTAGVRETSDVVEREGVARAEGALGVAALVLVVVDRSQPIEASDRRILDDTRQRPRIIVRHKSDLPSACALDVAGDVVDVSSASGEGLDELRAMIADRLSGHERLRDTPAISNARHIALLEQARAHLARAADASGASTPEEFLLADLQQARASLEEITGTRTSDDLLQHIFERFCIGK